ncbi:glutathione S-transferase family protein [Sphingomonas sp.]|uniref:glutathione S-transferase family protein n=1 Tax=Sphingomonas sp. TaxID=28214 RepID=UPI002FC994E6
MITLYTWKTPNGRKPAIMLEEIGMPYEVVGVDIGKNEQFSPEFLAIAPNNKIPAIVDDQGPGGRLSIFESGAILTYLAERSGLLLAASGADRFKALEWLHWQIGGLGPMLGQLGFFAVRSEEKVPAAISRFSEEAERLLGVMEKRLTAVPYLAGQDYSIADIACYPWMTAAASMMKPVLGPTFDKAKSIADWMERVGARPAVQRGMKVLEG